MEMAWIFRKLNYMGTKDKMETKFLARKALWNWADDETIDILNINNEVISHLNKWQSFVFYEADGRTTPTIIIENYVDKFKEMDEQKFGIQILSSLTELIFDYHVLEIWNNENQLPYYIQFPRSEQDQEKALELMKSDRFIK